VCLTPVRTGGHPATAPSAAVVSYAITSGNLVRLDLFEKIGLYDEGFFIDCVDFDLSLRLRRAGYAVHQVQGARMRHELGEATPRTGVLDRFYAQHAPARRYYMFRNFLYLAERHARDFPGFIAKLGVLQGLLALLILFRDPAPLASYRAIARGLTDYIVRRDGPYLEPAP
jgi:rhamnosyltransferase